MPGGRHDNVIVRSFALIDLVCCIDFVCYISLVHCVTCRVCLLVFLSFCVPHMDCYLKLEHL